MDGGEQRPVVGASPLISTLADLVADAGAANSSPILSHSSPVAESGTKNTPPITVGDRDDDIVIISEASATPEAKARWNEKVCDTLPPPRHPR